MRISPNGKKRISTAQKSMDFDPLGTRPAIQQEDLSFTGNDSQYSYNPMSQLESDLADARGNKKKPFDANKFNFDQQFETSKNQKNSTGKSQSMRRSYFEDFLPNKFNLVLKLNDEEKKNKLFNAKGTIGGNVSGFFVVPLKVNGNEIDEDEAKNLAKEFAEQHGVDENMAWDTVGENIKFNFTITKQTSSPETNSSLDAIIGGTKKAAASKHDIIKNSRTEIINTLIDKGFGGKNAP